MIRTGLPGRGRYGREATDTVGLLACMSGQGQGCPCKQLKIFTRGIGHMVSSATTGADAVTPKVVGEALGSSSSCMGDSGRGHASLGDAILDLCGDQGCLEDIVAGGTGWVAHRHLTGGPTACRGWGLGTWGWQGPRDWQQSRGAKGMGSWWGREGGRQRSQSWDPVEGVGMEGTHEMLSRSNWLRACMKAGGSRGSKVRAWCPAQNQ
jgi:hypothetical protein